ncbi:uncharacterized protein LOC106131949 [Amyelois transitella]|uniref:uncharacterized protein LOC106131949 n=1 Tax=Amyelois transitella TaxID=680683 RepID=UPI00299079B0|nr:uncharacterized protein LOC106131949 [Amyelois transitella]
MTPPQRGHTCAGCRQIISGRHICCTSSSCKKIFDLTCTKAAGLKPEEINIWICPECRAARRKTGDTTTPLRLSSTASSETDNVTMRKKTSMKSQDTNEVATKSQNVQEVSASENIRILANEIRGMRADMDLFRMDVTSRFETLATSLLEKGNLIDILENKQEELERRNTELETTVLTLQERIAQMSQRALRKEVEILGVHETDGEEPKHLTLLAATKIGLDLDVKDIDEATRAGAKRKSAGEDPEVKRHPRPIVVRFTTKATRDKFLSTARSRRTLDSKDIAEGGPARKVYVNERLTTENRQLFRAARTRAQECGYKFCWVKNGNIYVKKHERSSALRINSSSDIHCLGGPALHATSDQQSFFERSSR